jgi:hypothetical protein
MLWELLQRARPAALVVAEYAGNGAWTVRLIEPGQSLLLFSSRALDGREVDPRAAGRPRLYFDCSWAFVLVPEGDATTSLLVRSRLRMVPGWALHGAGLLMFGDTVMQRAMLRGIKQRVEQATRQQPAEIAGGSDGRSSDRLAAA